MRPPGIPVQPLLVAVFIASLALGAGRATPAEAATFEVNVADDTDDGVCDATHCSLREAINGANAAAGADTITFNIGGGGLQTIEPNSSGLGPLPEITDTVTVDGTTQPGYAGSPLVVLKGTLVPTGYGLSIATMTSGHIVRGLAIGAFSVGIQIGERAIASIESNYIGTDETGRVARPNGVGVQVHGEATITANVVSGNTQSGIRIAPRDTSQAYRPRATIRGNRVGTDPAGVFAVKTILSGDGITIFDSFGTVIGGPDQVDRNVISGNGIGIYGFRHFSSGNPIDPLIENNLIGVGLDGSRAIPNGSGIMISGRPDATIVGNVISGNLLGALNLSGPFGSPVIIANRIGTDQSGHSALPNRRGIFLSTPSALLENNHIAGNRDGGVELSSTAATFVENLIGVANDMVSPLGNGGPGVEIDSAVTNVFTSGNVIAYNAAGIISWHASLGQSLVFENNGLDISTLSPGAVSPPMITSYTGGALSGSACANCDVHVYTHGGRHFRGVATADGAGAWSLPLDAGGAAIATATDGTNGTSEYSLPFNLGPGPDPDGDGVAEADDNCIAAANSDQANADGNLIDITPPHLFDDLTQVLADSFGDACDGDDDNDGLPDSVETGGPPCASASAATGPLLRDSDRDLAADGAECVLGTDPADASSRPPMAPAGDADNDGLPDAFEPNIGTEPNDRDTDDDGVSDGIEYIRYNSNPLSANGDGDTCSDGKELASVDANTAVGASDLGLIAGAFGMYGVPVPSGSEWRANMDIDKNGVVNAADLGLAASQFGGC